MRKLNMANVKESMPLYWSKESVGNMQIAVFVMCGGGHLGRFAAEQPAHFYIDDRCGKLPYSKSAIYQAVEVLKVAAEVHGLDPRNMPKMPDFHNMGVF